MSKEFRSKRYEGVFYRELSNGDKSYFLRIRLDGKTTRIPIGKRSEGITEAFCNQERIRVLNAHRFGENVAAELQRVKTTDPTFMELVAKYVESGKASKNTIGTLKVLEKAPFAQKRKITTADVQNYIDELAKDHKPSTVGLRYRVVRMIMRHAIQRGFYKYSDPSIGIELPKIGDSGVRKRYLTPEEVDLLLDTVRDKPRLYLFVKIALCTGGRLGSLMMIHENDIQPDGAVRLYNQKQKRYYTGWLDDETMKLLEGRKGYVLARRGKEDKMPGKHQIQRPLLKIMDELFNPPGTPEDMRAVIHSLRHSTASQMLRKGVPIEIISKALDHSNIQITSRVYAKVAPDLIKKSVADLWS